MPVMIEPLLWKYDTLKNGEYAVQIRLTKYKDVKYISTGFSCLLNDWDEKNNLPLPVHTKYKEIIKKINKLVEDASFEVKLAEKHDEILTMAELKRRVTNKHQKTTPKKILEFFDEIIAELSAAGRDGYADVFSACKATVDKLLSSNDKPFVAFTEKDFKQYEVFIRSLETESTKSVYLRTFYRLWNLAIERKLCPEKHHPKFTIKYQAYKRIKTRKRAIQIDYIKFIEQLKFDYSSRLFRSQQYCLFTYYSRGINFSDLAKLKHGVNVKNGHVYYKRSKNGKIYDFELHPKSKNIIEIFKQYPLESDADYVFPILMSIHDSSKKINVRIDSALKDFNEDLQIFENEIKCPKHITSYVIRHSFATNLRDKNVSVSIIKEALGHETELQTTTYLEEIDDSIIAKSIEDALK